MMIDLCCQKCHGSFDMDATELLDGEAPIKCPNCDALLPQAVSEELGASLAELCKCLAIVRKKFAVGLSLDSDDLPAPYDLDDSDEEEEEEYEDLDEDDEDEEEEDEEDDDDVFGDDRDEDEEDDF